MPSITDQFKSGLPFLRRVRCLANTTAILAPTALSIIIFLVTYNNSVHGKLILTLVVSSAMFLWRLPTTWVHQYIDAKLLRLTSLYIAFIFASWLFLELVFPYAFPKDYAQLMDLTKAIRGDDSVPPSSVNEIFENEDQHIDVTKQRDTLGQRLKISWHRPGERFQYHGYDPNSGKTYLNRFFWNSQGYFDHDRAFVKPPHTKRIVVIGDSYVEAVQVPLSKTFHKQMEAFLNDNRGSITDATFQVIALGNSGTGQSTNLNMLKQDGLAYQPDLVIFTLCSNDFCDDDPALKRQLILSAGEFGPHARGLVRHGLMAAVLVVRRVETMRRSRVAISPELLQWSAENFPVVEKAWERTLDYVRQAKIICDRAGIAFLLTYLGAEIEVNYAVEPAKTLTALRGMGNIHASTPWDMGRSAKRVQHYCTEHSIEFISLLGPLIRTQEQTKKRVFGDHYTILGHEIVSRVLGCAALKCLVRYPPQALDECVEEDQRP